MPEKGFVYILKDSHFRRGVKIGRARDVDKRMRPMLTANPWLSVYIKVETSKWIELEKAVHNVIKLVAKTKQVKNSEFYLIEPEKAKKIMLEFSSLFDKEDFKIYLEDGTIVNEPKKKGKEGKSENVVRAKPMGFSALGISQGAELVFVPTGLKVVVDGEKAIRYKGMKYSLSGFTKKFIPICTRRQTTWLPKNIKNKTCSDSSPHTRKPSLPWKTLMRNASKDRKIKLRSNTK